MDLGKRREIEGYIERCELITPQAVGYLRDLLAEVTVAPEAEREPERVKLPKFPLRDGGGFMADADGNSLVNAPVFAWLTELHRQKMVLREAMKKADEWLAHRPGCECSMHRAIDKALAETKE